MWALMMSPLAKGLFRAAVDMSGSYVFKASLKEAEADNLPFLEQTGCKDLACLRGLSITKILQAGHKHARTHARTHTHTHTLKILRSHLITTVFQT